MSRSNNRSTNRYHQEDLVYEKYEDDYELQFRMQIQQQRGLKKKDTGKFRRSRQILSNSHPAMKRPLISRIKDEPSERAIVEEDGDEEEEVYEELDEDEDAEYETGVVDDARRSTYRPSDNSDKSSSVVAAARCISCNRCYTAQFRLFRWPRDEQIREKWCDLLGLDFDKIRSSLDSAFLCAFHFNATDFICSPDFTQIHWSSQAKPRPRSECQHPYEWEKPLPRIPSGPSKHDYIIKFRASKFRINRTKNTHPVAIISCISRPNIQYEFSWNRTSSLDGSTFYSCLHCRKANQVSGGKDNVRTIHLNGTELLSEQDPLSGHHHACMPIKINTRMDEMEGIEGYEREEEMGLYKKHNDLSGEMNGMQKNGLNSADRVVYVDDSQAFSSGAVVEVASDGLWTTAEDEGSTVSMHTVDEHHSNMDDLLLGGPSTSHGWLDYSKMDGNVWKEHEVAERRDTSSIRKKIIKKYRNRRLPYSAPSLSCPICSHRLPSTSRLIRHLEEHARNGVDCAVCGGKIDPSLPSSIRRSRICSLCKYHNQ